MSNKTITKSEIIAMLWFLEIG